MYTSVLTSSGSRLKTLPIAAKKSVETNPVNCAPESAALILPAVSYNKLDASRSKWKTNTWHKYKYNYYI